MSGWATERPALSAPLITPKWQWTNSSDIILSGVNFVGPIARRLGYTKPAARANSTDERRKYRAIYVGSSSLNKNFLLALIILLFSRRPGRRPDVMFVKKFRGFAGAMIYAFANICSSSLRLIGVGVQVKCSTQGFSRQTIYDALSNADYAIVPYFREGFPRLIGECFYFAAEPLVWRFMSFAETEVKGLLPRYGIQELISALSKHDRPFVPNSEYEQRLSFIEPFDRLREIEKKVGAVPEDLNDTLAVSFYERLTLDRVSRS